MGIARTGARRWRIALLAVGLCWAGGDTVEARPLPEELTTLLADSPQLRAAINDVRAAEEGVGQARAPFLPSVSLSGDKGWERIDSPERRANPGEASSLAKETATLSARLNLFDGFAKDAGLTVAERRLDLAKLTLDSLRQRLLFEGTQVYLTLLRQIELRAFARLAEETVDEQVALQRDLVAQGAATEVDSLLVRTRATAARERRVTIEAQLREISASYLRLFGRAPDLERLVDPGTLAVDVPETLEAAVAFALENHPDTAAAMRQVEIADQGRTQARAGYFPRIDVVTEGAYKRNDDGTRGIRREQRAMVQFSWQLYDGGATRSTARRSSYQHAATLDRRLFVENRIAEEVRKAWNQLDLARERVRILSETAELAGEIVAARREQLAGGRETALAVLDAEGEAISARMNLITARFDARIALRRLLLAMGVHTTELTLGVPSETLPEPPDALEGASSIFP